MSDEPLMSSYVKHGSQWFLISTIRRDSSVAVHPPPRFAETIVWETAGRHGPRGRQIHMDGSGEAFTQHMGICEQLFKTGEINDD